MKKLFCILVALLLVFSSFAYAEPAGQQGANEEQLYQMIPVFDSLARNMVSENQAVYNASDAQFFWAQILSCAVNWGHTNDLVMQENGQLIFPASVIGEYASASFYGTDGLPNIPDSVTGITFDAGTNTYRIPMSDADSSYIVIERYAQDKDGTLLAGIGVFQSDNTRQGGILVRMAAKAGGNSTTESAFPYSVKAAQVESGADFTGLDVKTCKIRYVDETAEPTVTPALTPQAPTATQTPEATKPAATQTPAANEYTKLSTGSRGEDVRKLQTRLKELGYKCSTDGKFGSSTKQAVRYFQDALGEDQDGIASSALQQRLYATDAPEFVQYVTLSSGLSGIRVEKLQARLRDLGYLAEPMDGDFGSRTKDAVKLFQSKANLKSDGIAGERTLKALNKKDAPKCTDYITLKKGDTGIRVKEMQACLKKLGFLSKDPSGTYNNDTVDALLIFIKAEGINGNGKTADKDLLKKLFEYTPSTPTPIPTPTPAPSSDPTPTPIPPTPTPVPGPVQAITNDQLNAYTLALNGILTTTYSNAEAVNWLQQKLSLTPNGVYDSATKDAVTAYQTAQSLTVTGIADADTINKLK